MGGGSAAVVFEQVREAAAALAADRVVRAQLFRVQALLGRLHAEQAVLEERSRREASDVDRLEGWSLDWMSSLLSGSIEKDRDRERSESLEAGMAALAHAHATTVVEEEQQRLVQARSGNAEHRFWTVRQALTMLDHPGTSDAFLVELGARERAAMAEARLARVDAALEGLDALEAAETPPDRGEARGRVVLSLEAAGFEEGEPNVAILRAAREAAVADIEAARANADEVSARTEAVFAAPPAEVRSPDLQGAVASLRRAFALRIELLGAHRAVRHSRRSLEQRERVADSERRDVKRLEHAGPTRWTAWLSGRLGEQLLAERAELEEAVRELAERVRAHGELEIQEQEVRSRLEMLGPAEDRLASMEAADLGTHAIAAHRAVAASRELREMVEVTLVIDEIEASVRGMKLPHFGWFQPAPSIARQLKRVRDAVLFHGRLVRDHGLDLEPLSAKDLLECLHHIEAFDNVSRKLGKNAYRRATAPHIRGFQAACDRYYRDYRAYTERFAAFRDEVVEGLGPAEQALDALLSSLEAAIARESHS